MIRGPKIRVSHRIQRGPVNIVIKVVAHGDHDNMVSYQLELSLCCFSLSCNLLGTSDRDSFITPEW